ncbi:MAG TPA: PQQ-binding-like beta-propeller repeat protein [Aestuariivirgaceae bacterium]|nr:PQQ-binding-like beta-propeller repeat protein [Aestuariivirgaceae bacterium]
MALGLLLSGCGAAEQLVGKFGGGGSDEILPGVREAVMQPNTLGVSESQSNEPVVIPAAISNAEWTQPGGVASHAMHNLALGSDIKQVFGVRVAEGSDSYGRLTASPIVAGGRVYVLDSRAEVKAVSAGDGAILWSTSLVPEDRDGRGAFGGGLATDGSRLYATTAFGEVVALDLANGSIAWRKNFELPIRSAPTVDNGRVFFATVSNDTYAVSAADGSQLWRFQGIGEQASISASPSPVVADGHVVVPHTTGELIAFRTEDGTPVWTETLTSLQPTSSLANINDIAGRPVIADGQVYAIAHSGRLGAFLLQTGEPVWAQEISGTQMPWVAGGYAFVISGTAGIAAVERGNGAVRWTANLPGGGVWSGPVLGGGRLIAVSSKGMLANISPQTGEVLSTIDLGEEFYIAPVIANGTLYLLADSGTLIALR